MARKVPLQKLHAAFVSADGASTATTSTRSLKKLVSSVTPCFSATLSHQDAEKLYLFLRKVFVLMVSHELKQNGEGDPLRVDLYRSGHATKAEMLFRENLLKLLANPSFKAVDVLRYYRLAERNLKKFSGEDDSIKQDEVKDITLIFQRVIKLPTHPSLKGEDRRAKAFPEDSIMVECAPPLLVDKAHIGGVVAPELMSFEELTTSIITERL